MRVWASNKYLDRSTAITAESSNDNHRPKASHQPVVVQEYSHVPVTRARIMLSIELPACLCTNAVSSGHHHQMDKRRGEKPLACRGIRTHLPAHEQAYRAAGRLVGCNRQRPIHLCG